MRVIALNTKIGAWIYVPSGHCADVVAAEKAVVRSILEDVEEQFFPVGDGCLLLFACQRSYLESYYTNPESLALRESGGVAATIALVAEALSLTFCQLGSLAGPWTGKLLGVPEEWLLPCGAAVIGGRQATSIGGSHTKSAKEVSNEGRHCAETAPNE